MRIIVCVKQVLVIHASTESENDRETCQLLNNPNDLNALEEALRLKEQYGGQITCLSMGPRKCEQQLRELLAMGADEAVLLSSPQFAGSDTYVTACILAAGIQKLGNFRIVITGEQSIDGETGQVGPSVAEILGIPHIIGVEKIKDYQSHSLLIEKSDEEHRLVVKLPAPALLAVRKSCNTPRIPSIRGRIAAARAEITVWSEEDLSVNYAAIGTTGSPTQVIRTVQCEKNHQKANATRFFDEANLRNLTEVLSHVLES